MGDFFGSPFRLKCTLCKNAMKEENVMETKKYRKIIIAIVILAVAATAMFGLYKVFMPEPKQGLKEITVTVVHGDQSQKEFSYETEEKYLAPVITGEGLAKGTEGEYGLFILTVDGETADDTKEEWWCITKKGKTVTTSASELVIEDGDEFELTLMEGY